MPDVRTILTLTPHTAIDRVIEAPGFEVGAHVEATQRSRYPAGKGINVSRALSSLGRSTVATGWVGRNESALFEKHLADSGPGKAVAQLVPVDGSTRENITIIDPKRRTDTHLRGRGFEVTPRDHQRLMSKVSVHARPRSVIVVSGSLCPGVTPAFLNELGDAVHRGGGRLVLDTTPQAARALLGMPEGGGGYDWSAASRKALMLAPNRDELLELLGERRGDDETLLTFARRLQAACEWVLLTLGGGGAVLVGPHAAWRGRVDLPPEEVVHTVGCGDCALAGALDALAEGLSPDRWLARAVAAGAANAASHEIGRFDPQRVQELENRAEVEKVRLPA